MLKTKMEFKELINLEKYFGKYLTYKGFNLWQLSETPIYENFIKFPKKKSFLDKKRDFLLRYIVKIKGKQKEKEKTEEIGKGKEIFMITYGVSPINTFKPIIEKMREKIKVIRYEPPSENVTKNFLQMYKIPYSNIEVYINQSITKELKKAKKWLANQWKLIKKDKELKYLLKKNYVIVMRALEYFCHTRKSYLEVIRLIELYIKAYDIEKPKLVIVSDDSNIYGRVAVFVARKKGVKSVCIQHGQLKGNVVVNKGADKIIVNGGQDKKYLISQKVDKKKIIVTGQTRFDNLAKIKITKKQVCKELGLNPNKKIVIFTAQKPTAGENVTLSAINCFLEEIKKIPNKEDFQFIITMRQDVNQKVFPKIDKNLIKIIKGGDIQKILGACDVYSTAFSTAGIEAVLLGKPVIAINLDSKSEEYVDYTKSGVGFKITKKEDFLPALKTCLENKKFKKKFKKARQKFIKDYNYKLDGRALERILKIIKNMLSE